MRISDWSSDVCSSDLLCWEDHSDIGLIDHLPPRQADRPKKATLAQSMAEWRAGSVASVRKHAAEVNARRNNAVDLLNRDLGLRRGNPTFHRYPSARHTIRVTCPAFRQKQPESHHHRHFTRCQRRSEEHTSELQSLMRIS